MIRNVVIHISNEQPLLADLFTTPTPADVGLVCTNIRMIDGKKPIFIDRTDSTFFFPNIHIRFLEIPNAEIARHLATAGAPGQEHGFTGEREPGGTANEAEGLDPERRLPIPLGGALTFDTEPDGDPDAELDLEIDPDFLRRVRDI